MRGYSLPLYKTSRPTYQVRSFAYTTIADNLAYGTRLCSIGVVLPSRLTVLQGVVPASAERSVHSAKHASYAAHNQRSICENGFAVSARSRLTEMAAAAVLLVFQTRNDCGFLHRITQLSVLVVRLRNPASRNETTQLPSC